MGVDTGNPARILALAIATFAGGVGIIYNPQFWPEESRQAQAYNTQNTQRIDENMMSGTRVARASSRGSVRNAAEPSERTVMKSLLLGTVLASGLAFGAGNAAHASLIADGITYTLTSTAVNSTTETFTLGISGINGAADTEKGRYGVESIVFSDPFADTTPTVTAAGFTALAGGLNANGCGGSGSFFCLQANTTPTSPALAAGSSLSFTFTVTTTSPFPSDYDPDFKINWVGTKKNYDLVSKQLTPEPGSVTSTPEPASLALLGMGLATVGLFRRRRSVPQA